MSKPIVKLACEGVLDYAVLRRLVMDAGLEAGEPFGFKGKNFIDRRLQNYNRAAAYEPWIVVRDLDRDAVCAPGLVSKLLSSPSQLMCFRIAVRTIECWLIADRGEFAKSFALSIADIPMVPEEVLQPKAEITKILAKSGRREIRETMVAHGRQGLLSEGPEYNARLEQFALDAWRPKVAAKNSPSLLKAINRLSELRTAALSQWIRK